MKLLILPNKFLTAVTIELTIPVFFCSASLLASSYKNSRRLIETEVQASQVRSNIDNYKNNGIEKVEISAVLDDKCCMDCADHDGKIIDSNKIELYDVILHCNCRCTTLPCIYIDGKLIE